MKLGNTADVTPWKAGSAPPPGTYTARIDDASEGESKNKHPQFVIDWTVVGGDYDGASLTEYLVIPRSGPGHDIGLSKAVALVDALGIDRSVDDFDLDAKMLVGKYAVIVCVGEQGYNDPSKTYTKVSGHKAAHNVPTSNGNGSNGSDANGGEPLPF